MLKTLQTAIFTKFNSAGGATLRALVQGMWEDLAPSSKVSGTQYGTDVTNSVLPWITFTTVLTSLEQDTCSNIFLPLVQFTIFGDADNKKSDEVLDIGREFLSLYGDVILTLDNGYEMTRADTVDNRKFIDDDKKWQLVITIEYTIQKDR